MDYDADNDVMIDDLNDEIMDDAVDDYTEDDVDIEFDDSVKDQGCGNTMPDLSVLVPFHSGQVEKG